MPRAPDSDSARDSSRAGDSAASSESQPVLAAASLSASLSYASESNRTGAAGVTRPRVTHDLFQVKLRNSRVPGRQALSLAEPRSSTAGSEPNLKQ